VLFQQKLFHANIKESFRFTKILYYSELKKKGYYTEFNCKKFFGLLIDFIKIRRKLLNNYNQISKRYQAEMPLMMTKQFWQQVYKK
jgi:hypothetical protein